MKTKFILHGGFTPGGKQEDDPFFQEILKGNPENSKILLVYFAKEADRVEKNRLEDIVQFNKNAGARNIIFDVATQEDFPEQVEKSDIIYLHGGRTIKLADALLKYSNLDELFNGKIVAGDSAGANVLATIYYSPSSDVVGEGFGLLPIKLIPHYSPDLSGKLDGKRKDLETVCLREYEYRVFYEGDE